MHRGRCRLPLELCEGTVCYLDTIIKVELLTCPRCGQVFVPESLARGRMAEIEQILEDK